MGFPILARWYSSFGVETRPWSNVLTFSEANVGRTDDRTKRPLLSMHDDVIKWKHFLCCWPFVRGIHRSPWNFDVFFDLHPNKRLSKQWWGWWFETLSCPLWRHRNDMWYDPEGAHCTRSVRYFSEKYAYHDISITIKVKKWWNPVI